MKKFLVITICLCAAAVFARTPHHRRHHRHHGGNDGVWLAAGITHIIANGIGIFNAVTTPRYQTPAPVYTVPATTVPVVLPQVPTIQNSFYERYVPTVQTVMVPVYINGQLFYRQEQRTVYVK